MAINIIAARDGNYLIGLNGKLPWNIPADLKRFKELTTGHAVIMGRKTFESLGSKPLPDRNNFVVGSKLASGMFVHEPRLFPASSLKYALSRAEAFKHDEIFIIGGARLYAEAMPIADRIYMTRVDAFVPVKPEDEAVYFPHRLFDVKDWELASAHTFPQDTLYSRSVEFQIFERRK